MRNSRIICCDANIVIRVLNRDPATSTVTVWENWAESNTRIVAPRLIYYEVINALHRLTSAGEIAEDTADQLAAVLKLLPIEMIDDYWIHEQAMVLTRRFNRPAVYDSHYLAVAERLNTEFWTMDKRLYDAVQHHLPWVRLLD